MVNQYYEQMQSMNPNKNKGFLDGFVEGFVKTTADTITTRKKREEEIDAVRKEEIAKIDPAVELYKRKSQIDAEKEAAARADRLARVNDYMGGTVAPSGSMVQSTPEGIDTSDINQVFADMQRLMTAKSKAEAVGDAETVRYFDTQIDQRKSQIEFLKFQGTQSDKPVSGAEDTNIVESIGKQFEDDVKNKTSVSQYFPTKLNKLVNDPSVLPEHRRLNEQHQALAQAVAVSQRDQLSANTPEVAATVQRETAEVIRNVNTLMVNDARITPQDKAKAARAIEAYFDRLTPIEQERIKQDPNFQQVFTPEVIDVIESMLGGQSSAPAKATAPKASLTTSPEAAKIKADYKAGRISRQEAIQKLNAIVGQPTE